MARSYATGLHHQGDMPRFGVVAEVLGGRVFVEHRQALFRRRLLLFRQAVPFEQVNAVLRIELQRGFLSEAIARSSPLPAAQ